MLCSSLYQCLVHFGSLLHLIGWDFLDSRSTSIRTPTVFLHQQDINQGIEARTCGNRILDRNNLASVDVFQLLQDSIIIHLFVIHLIHQEDDRLVQFLGIAEMVLCTYLHAIGTKQQHSCIRHIHGSQGSTYKVVTTRAVDDVQFLVVPFYMEYGREYGIAIFLLYWEIITYCIMLCDASTTLDNTCFIQKGLGQGCLAGPIIAQESNVLNFIGLIDSHIG